MTNWSPLHEIAHLARVELLSPKPQETVEFFTKYLGMYVTLREGQSVYMRAYEDPYQWSIKVTESDQAGMRHGAFRTSSAEALERRVASLSNDPNVEGAWHEDEFGYGKNYRFKTPDGHTLDIVWEAEHYKAPAELQSKILTRASKRPLQGLPVKRIDHLNLMASSVEPMEEAFQRHLGFRVTERVVAGPVEIGSWMSSNILGHELACMRDNLGLTGRMHHVAMYYGNSQHLKDAAEIFRDNDIVIEAGPDTHGITQGQFLYVFEPGGNRIELFGEPGILHMAPDLEPPSWNMENLAETGLAIGGATLPWETYFTYGTPNPQSLEEHQKTYAGAAPPPPAGADELTEDILEEVDEANSVVIPG